MAIYTYKHIHKEIQSLFLQLARAVFIIPSPTGWPWLASPPASSSVGLGLASVKVGSLGHVVGLQTAFIGSVRKRLTYTHDTKEREGRSLSLICVDSLKRSIIDFKKCYSYGNCYLLRSKNILLSVLHFSRCYDTQ